jgi:hypothetical protein
LGGGFIAREDYLGGREVGRFVYLIFWEEALNYYTCRNCFNYE